MIEVLKVYAARKNGERGITVHLPAKFFRLAGIKPRTRVEVALDTDNKYLLLRKH